MIPALPRQQRRRQRRLLRRRDPTALHRVGSSLVLAGRHQQALWTTLLLLPPLPLLLPPPPPPPLMTIQLVAARGEMRGTAGTATHRGEAADQPRRKRSVVPPSRTDTSTVHVVSMTLHVAVMTSHVDAMTPAILIHVDATAPGRATPIDTHLRHHASPVDHPHHVAVNMILAGSRGSAPSRRRAAQAHPLNLDPQPTDPDLTRSAPLTLPCRTFRLL